MYKSFFPKRIIFRPKRKLIVIIFTFFPIPLLLHLSLSS